MREGGVGRRRGTEQGLDAPDVPCAEGGRTSPFPPPPPFYAV